MPKLQLDDEFAELETVIRVSRERNASLRKKVEEQVERRIGKSKTS